MFSPTGYFAHMTLTTWDHAGKCDRPIREIRPVLLIDLATYVIDENGNLVTPQQYIAPYAAHWMEENTDTARVVASFEIQPFGDDE